MQPHDYLGIAFQAKIKGYCMRIFRSCQDAEPSQEASGGLETPKIVSGKGEQGICHSN